MATLHILADPGAVASCLGAAASGDRVLLIDDGVFAAARRAADSAPAARVERWGALREHAAARGVTLDTAVEALDYDDFVAWVCSCERSVTWT